MPFYFCHFIFIRKTKSKVLSRQHYCSLHAEMQNYYVITTTFQDQTKIKSKVGIYQFVKKRNHVSLDFLKLWIASLKNLSHSSFQDISNSRCYQNICFVCVLVCFSFWDNFLPKVWGNKGSFQSVKQHNISRRPVKGVLACFRLIH